MRLADYINKEKTTVAILRDWRNQEFILESGRDILSEIESKLLRVTSNVDKICVSGGGGNNTEEKLVSGIAKKDLAKKGVKNAAAYFEELIPAWEKLSETERFVLTARFIDEEIVGGNRAVMEKFHVEKSEAYEMARRAVRHLSSLLFW